MSKRNKKQRNKKGSNVLLNFKDEPKHKQEIELDQEIDELLNDDEYDAKNDRKNPNNENEDDQLTLLQGEFVEKLDMRAVLGYLNQSEWISNINIGNIMQINPFEIDEQCQVANNEYQLSRISFLEKISLLAVGYF